jgi:hypothetical protein
MYTILRLAAIASPLILRAVAESADWNNMFLQNDRTLALFTSSSLASVQSYEPMLKRATENSTTKLITIDCDQEMNLCERHDINSYPTIRLFEKRDGEENPNMARYRGSRTQNAIKGWINRKELPIVSHVTPEDLEAFTQTDDIVIIAYLPPSSPHLIDTFTSIAQQHHTSHVFGYTTTPSTSAPSIKVFKNPDADHRLLTGPFTPASLQTFLATAIPPVIRTFREKELEIFMQRDKLTVYIFTPPPPAATTLLRSLTPLAKKYAKFATFAIADSVKQAEMATNFLGRFGRDGGIKTGVVVHAPMNDNVFMYQAGRKIEVKELEEMLMTILQGKAKSGDVFGSGAEDGDGDEGEGGHDEL